MSGSPEGEGHKRILPRAKDTMQAGSSGNCSPLHRVKTDENRDLFSKDSAESSSPLTPRDHGDDGILVSGLKSVFVSSKDEVRELLLIARSKRATSSTMMNHQSSRSHAMDN